MRRAHREKNLSLKIACFFKSSLCVLCELCGYKINNYSR
jgi:hypothetical protein